MNLIENEASEFLLTAHNLEITPWVPILSEAPTDSYVIADGKKSLFFSSNNYLGLAGRPEIKEALIRGVEKYGFGSGASRLVGGTFESHIELEERIAKFKDGEAAIIFSTGSIANDTVIPALLNVPMLDVKKIISKGIFNFLGGKEVAVFSDELNHASIVDGCRLANAERNIYKHLDLDHLESLLKKSKARKKLIVSDSVFSMDGDMVDVKRIAHLKEKYNSLLYLDEAHSSGVIGKKGKGVSEEFSINNIDIKMGTFSKAFGGAGGFIVANKVMIDYLRLSCRKYIFSTAMPPALAVGLIKSVDLVESAEKEREGLKNISIYFRQKAKVLGFNTMSSTTQIIPIHVGDEKKTMIFAQKMRERKIHTPAVIWPATPRGAGRLRISLIATHTIEDIDKLLENLSEVGMEIGVI